jgi:hypothetical protein
MLRGQPLDREGDDLTRVLLRLALGLLPNLAAKRLGLAPGLILGALEQLTPGFVGRESRDALEPSLLLPDQGGGLASRALIAASCRPSSWVRAASDLSSCSSCSFRRSRPLSLSSARRSDRSDSSRRRVSSRSPSSRTRRASIFASSSPAALA